MPPEQKNGASTFVRLMPWAVSVITAMLAMYVTTRLAPIRQDIVSHEIRIQAVEEWQRADAPHTVKQDESRAVLQRQADKIQNRQEAICEKLDDIKKDQQIIDDKLDRLIIQTAGN